ncbi:MAG: hypothetical protein L6Q75_10975 [Burkholderiaceae bacterium]|nr:hypothetical protein [Burkholderiaceae bacterium]
MSRAAQAPVPQGTAQPPVVPQAEPRILLEDEHSRIEWHHPPGGESRPLVITFDPLMHLVPRPAFGVDFLLRLGAQVIAVRRKSEHFYQPLSREAFTAAVRPCLHLPERVLAYGSSLGAYAALYYAHDLDAEVIALSPRVSVHPVYGNKAWQERAAFLHEPFEGQRAPQCRAVIAYDPYEAIDRRFIDACLRPHFQAARFLRVPFTGHPTTQFFSDIGHLAPWIRAVVADRPAPELDRRRQRRRSTTYYQVLADLCARRGRLAVADVLVERSLALRDRHMLAHRTRGLVKTLQQDWEAAVASLERALEFDPADPLTLSMLEKARRGRHGPPAPVAQAAAAPTSCAGSAPAAPAGPPADSPPWSRRLIDGLQGLLGRRRT